MSAENASWRPGPLENPRLGSSFLPDVISAHPDENASAPKEFHGEGSNRH